jgi:hypothetical protein
VLLLLLLWVNMYVDGLLVGVVVKYMVVLLKTQVKMSWLLSLSLSAVFLLRGVPLSWEPLCMEVHGRPLHKV